MCWRVDLPPEPRLSVPPLSERLSLKPLLLGGGLLIALVIGLAAFDAVYGYRQAISNANAGLDNVEHLLEEHALRALDGTDAVLKEAADSLVPLMQEPVVPLDAIFRILAARASHLSHIRTLFLVGADGRTITDSLGRPPGTGSPGDRDYFRVHVERTDAGLAVNRPARGVVDPRWRLPLSRRVSAPDGRFLGVIVALVEPEYFTSIYRALRLGDEGVVSIFRRDGIVLFRSFDSEKFIGQSLAHRPLFTELLPRAPQGRSWVDGGVDGISRLVGYRTLPRHPLVLSVGMARSDILGPWRERSILVGIAVTIIVLAIAGFVFLLARQGERQRELVRALADASERANAANRMKSEFLANMTHELRTPLNAVIGFAEMLDGEGMGKLNETQREYVANIDAAGRHLLDVISDVLNFAKIEAGSYRLEEEAFDLADLVDETVRLMIPAAAHAEIGLTQRNLQPDSSIVLRADRRAVKQMLLNLQSNAIKFTPKRGQVDVSYEVSESGLTIRTRDTGIGIPPDQRDKVLEPFSQLSNALNRTHQGTGLGLPIVRSLIEMHGGRLVIDGAEGAEGAGTTMILLFPRQRITVEAAPAPARREARSA